LKIEVLKIELFDSQNIQYSMFNAQYSSLPKSFMVYFPLILTFALLFLAG